MSIETEITRLQTAKANIKSAIEEKWGNSITHYMIQPPDKILEKEQIQSVLSRFEQNHTWMLPVVDRDNHYKGFISKSRILNAYREQLVKISQ